MVKKKQTLGRTSLGAHDPHAEAVRSVAGHTKGMNTMELLDAIIEGDEDLWRTVVTEFKRQKRKRRK